MTTPELAFLYKKADPTREEALELKRRVSEETALSSKPKGSSPARAATTSASASTASARVAAKTERAVASKAVRPVEGFDIGISIYDDDASGASDADDPTSSAAIFSSDIEEDGVRAPIDPRDHLIPNRVKIASLDPYSAIVDDDGDAKDTEASDAGDARRGRAFGRGAKRKELRAGAAAKGSADEGADEEAIPKTLTGKIAACVKHAMHEPVFIFAFVVLSFLLVFLRPFLVPSASMKPTLHEGDRILSIAQYLVNGETFSRGDIACFTAPDGTVYVKRVIGIGGDHIQISGEKVYVNGEESPYQGTGGVMTSMDVQLADDEYWMMGDNRGNSADSRFIGAIKADKMISKVFMIYSPFDRIGILE